MKTYTPVEMAALSFVEVSCNKEPENKIRDAMKTLMLELIRAGLLKLPLPIK